MTELDSSLACVAALIPTFLRPPRCTNLAHNVLTPSQLSTQLGVKCAPVGLAMRRSLATRPDLNMLGSDSEHETLEGTYLGAAVRGVGHEKEGCKASLRF